MSDSVRFIVDLVSLTKPRLASLVVFTTAMGILVAPGTMAFVDAVWAVALTTLIVASGTALNMYIERDVDALMPRTAQRALPTGRLRPAAALWFGILLLVIAIPLMVLKVNLLTLGLGLMAWTVYLFAYTPLKRRSVSAVYMGAIPGATPILMGWTAATGSISAVAMVLFGILFMWQIPHFIAISMFRREEYARAGLKVLPVEYGDRVSLWHMIGTSMGLVVATLAPVWFDVGGPLYTATACLLASVALGGAVWGIRARAGSVWARRYFFGTLIYLPLLLGVLAVDVL
jgi:protoheme IX farnesyltransferase